eukprot:1193996-Prorocentrum_minimum.AAC.9
MQHGHTIEQLDSHLDILRLTFGHFGIDMRTFFRLSTTTPASSLMLCGGETLLTAFVSSPAYLAFHPGDAKHARCETCARRHER